MTQFPHEEHFQNEYREVRGSNPLGIVGFVLSLLCMTSPVGLLISFIALFKSPRGFAIAGVLIGLLFSAILALFGWLASLAWPYVIETGEIIEDADALRNEIAAYKTANDGAMPTSIGDLGWNESDPWGNEYVLVADPTDQSWSLTTLGPDGLESTWDDFVITSDMGEDEISNSIAEWIGKRVEDRFEPKP